MNKTYLGDSVYASFDGYHIVLTTENDDSGPSNTIALEPDVLRALQNYQESLRPAPISDIPETIELALNSAEEVSRHSLSFIGKGRAMLRAIKGPLPTDVEVNAYGGTFWITVKRREDLQVLMQLAPRWNKLPHAEGIDYNATVDGVMFKLRTVDGALPPTCRLVEREVEIPEEPARPARIEKRMVVECVTSEPVPVES